jgi:hypothetical protein
LIGHQPAQVGDVPARYRQMIEKLSGLVQQSIAPIEACVAEFTSVAHSVVRKRSKCPALFSLRNSATVLAGATGTARTSL